MREQAQKYGAAIEDRAGDPARPRSRAASRPNGARDRSRARTVLLATGVTNRRPPMDEELHDEALARGLIRYCPICDGYEVTDKKVGVIGSGSARRRRGGVPARLHRRHHPDRAGQGARPRRRGPGAAARACGIAAVDGPCHAVRGAARTAIVVETAARPPHVRQRLSGARLRRAHRAGRADRRRAQPTRPAASWSTRTSAPTCPASMRPATSCSASTRSATPWAKAASRRRRSATIWRRSGRCYVREL